MDMKRFTGIMLSFILCFCMFGFTACGNEDLEARIAQLEEQLKNIGGEDVSSLKARVASLEGSLEELLSVIEGLEQDNEALEKLVSETRGELDNAKARLLLLEGRIDNPKQSYALGETVTYSNNGIKLFELTITEAWEDVDKDFYANFKFSNIGLPGRYVIDEIFHSYIWGSYGDYNGPHYQANSFDDKTIHQIEIGQSFTSSDVNLAYGSSKYLVGKQKVFFGIFNRVPDPNKDVPFTPFACFEIDFLPKA